MECGHGPARRSREVNQGQKGEGEEKCHEGRCFQLSGAFVSWNPEPGTLTRNPNPEEEERVRVRVRAPMFGSAK